MTPGVGQARLPLAALWLIFAATWLAGRPYVGVEHDGIFYLAQALARLEPERFAGDLFFRHGSQDSYSIFTLLYAPLVQWLGWVVAHPLMLAAGQALWIGALWFLMRGLFAERRAALLGCLGVALLPAVYGPLGALSYAESFVTARLFAEAAGLLALGLGLRRRFLAAFAAVLLAAALHPIMALPVAAVLGLLLLWGRWALLGALYAAGAAVLAALALGVDPGIALLRRMDAEWVAAVQARSVFAFPTRWDWPDWAQFAITLLLALAAALLAAGPRRGLAIAALAVALTGMALSLLGGDAARIHAVVAGQPWRWSWIAAVIAHGLFFAEILRFLDRQDAARGRWILFLMALLFSLLAAAFLDAAKLLSLLLLAAFIAGLLVPRASGAVAVLGLAAAPLCLAIGVALAGTAIHGLRLGDSAVALAIGFALFLKLLACALVIRWRAEGRNRAGRPFAALCLLLLSLAALDRRSHWQRFIETAPAGELQRFIGSEGAVLWDGGLEIMWFVLRRAHYFSIIQAAGLVFHRQTAMAFRQGLEDFPFATLDRPPFHWMLGADERPAAEALRRACQRHPTLAVIILPHEVPGLASAAWTLPVRHQRQAAGPQPGQRITFHRYDCAGLRLG